MTSADGPRCFYKCACILTVLALQTEVSSPRAGDHLNPASPEFLAAVRVAFVDDEAANCRMGLRMLSKLGVPRENITVLNSGAWSLCVPTVVPGRGRSYPAVLRLRA